MIASARVASSAGVSVSAHFFIRADARRMRSSGPPKRLRVQPSTSDWVGEKIPAAITAPAVVAPAWLSRPITSSMTSFTRSELAAQTIPTMTVTIA